MQGKTVEKTDGEGAPSISVKTHDDAFDSPSFFRICAFGEQLVDLLFRRIKTQISDLES